MDQCLKILHKNKAWILALFTAWPFLVFLAGLLFEAAGLFPKTAAPPPAFVLFYALLCLTPFVVLALLAFYIVYLATRPQLPLEWKLTWSAILILGNVLAMPVYWYLFICKPRPFAPMQPATRFSLLFFAPVLIAFLLPAAFLLPVGVTFIALGFSDPSTLAGAASYDLWIIVPLLAALLLFLIGRGLYSLHRPGRSQTLAWAATWAVFNLALFLALWCGSVVLGSVGASETAPSIYFGLAALAAAGLTITAQFLLLPWLFFVSKMLPRLQGTQQINPVGEGLALHSAAEHPVGGCPQGLSPPGKVSDHEA